METDALADSAWNWLRAGADAGEHSLDLAASHSLSASASATLLSAFYRAERFSLFLNQRRDWRAGLDAANFHLRAQASRWEVLLGDYRLDFGHGLVSGSGRGFADSLFELREPPSPQYYSLSGVAGQVGWHRWRLGVFASRQGREARLSDSLIVTLPHARAGLLTSATETVWGASLNYLADEILAGLLVWHQAWDRPRAEPLAGSWAVSASGSLNSYGHILEAEIAHAGGHPAWLLAWHYPTRLFTPSLSYGRNGLRGLLPYSVSAAILDPDTSRDEFDFALRVPLPLHFDLRLRYALNGGSLFSGEPLSRWSSLLRYSHRGSSAQLEYHSYDRELIALVDSAYVAGEPRNHRLRFTGSHSFHPRWRQSLELSYTLRDRRDATQNSFLFRLSLAYERPGLQLRAGLLGWQSQISFVAGDELSPEFYSVLSGDETALFASGSWAYRRLRLTGSLQKSLFTPGTWRLGVRAALSLF